MTQEEKQLLLKDLCGRLPYGVKVRYRDSILELDYSLYASDGTIAFEKYPMIYFMDKIEIIKPYLRPLNSMTEDEKKELGNFVAAEMFASQNKGPLFQLTRKALFADFFNKRHIDYRGLIEKGLALEAPEGMYKI